MALKEIIWYSAEGVDMSPSSTTVRGNSFADMLGHPLGNTSTMSAHIKSSQSVVSKEGTKEHLVFSEGSIAAFKNKQILSSQEDTFLIKRSKNSILKFRTEK